MNMRSYKRFAVALVIGVALAIVVGWAAAGKSDKARSREFTGFRGGPAGVYGYVAIPASLSRIRHPGSVSDLARFIGFRGGPGGIYAASDRSR